MFNFSLKRFHPLSGKRPTPPAYQSNGTEYFNALEEDDAIQIAPDVRVTVLPIINLAGRRVAETYDKCIRFTVGKDC